MKKLEFSINGLPWTRRKINTIIPSLKKGGSVGFAFGKDDVKFLDILNDEIFQQRDDIILHVWSVAKGERLSEENIKALAQMKNVKRLEISGFKNTEIDALGEMDHLEELKVSPVKKIDISFCKHFSNLKTLTLGNSINLDVLSACKSLESLTICTTVESYEFVEELRKLRKVIVHDCISTNDFSPFKHTQIESLGILSIKKLENIDSISQLESLQELDIHASLIQKLPSFENLNNIKKLSLRHMKKWENPSVIECLSNLEELELMEINTKLKADQFYFIGNLENIKSFDFRFIDFNKKRIDTLNKYFEDNDLEHIIKK